MKKIISMIGLSLIFLLFGCNNKNIITDSSITISKEDEEIMNKSLTLKINDNEILVNWLNNESINDLKELAKNEFIINMKKYGGFEQVGSIGKYISSNDERITTSPGDIVLYSSNQIVIFYGANTWEYTKLGHIDLSKEELTNLLGNDNVIIKLELK